MRWKVRLGVSGGRPSQPKEFGYYSSGSRSGHGCAWEHSPATLGKISGEVLGWPIGRKAGHPLQWAGPQRTEIKGEISSTSSIFCRLSLWAWWGGEFRKGWGCFPHWTPQPFQCPNWVLGRHRHPRTPEHQEQLTHFHHIILKAQHPMDRILWVMSCEY